MNFYRSTLGNSEDFSYTYTVENNGNKTVTEGYAYRLLVSNQALTNESIVVGNHVTNCFCMLGHCYNFNGSVNLGYKVDNCAYMLVNANSYNQETIIPASVNNCRSMFENCTAMNSNIYINGNVENKDITNMIYNRGNSKRINIFSNCDNTTHLGKVCTGSPITLTSMTNGYYNSAYNVYFYNNYNGV